MRLPQPCKAFFFCAVIICNKHGVEFFSFTEPNSSFTAIALYICSHDKWLQSVPVDFLLPLFKGRAVFPFLHTATGWGKLVQCEFGKALVSLGMSSPCLGLGRVTGLGCPAMDAAQQPFPPRSQHLLGEEGSRKM